ncbi:cytochrome c maturation protein CcmE [Candidatus Bathyarchaeota archaeon]|nr:cytochrome c maturation protein CcmE [Candidatus Bathyarchaeota archaeon]MBL7078912.1 cytochrome c maturation protein CcmE [Candidatus Bathyarchaeota archaeon]
MNFPKKYGVVAVFLVASAFLAYNGLSTYVNPYISVTQILSKPDRYIGRDIQVIGVPDFDSVAPEEGGIVKFDIEDEGKRLSVVFQGSLPQNFDQSTQVVVIGSVTSDGYIESDQLLVKCPSKYESTEENPQSNTFFIAAMLVAVLALGYLGVTMLWKKG